MIDLATVPRHVEDLYSLLSESPLVEKKAFLRSFVKEVRVTGNEVLLEYTIPLPPDGETHEPVGVLSTVRFGGAEGTRTPDPLAASQMLSQLSYSPTANLS